KFKFGNIADPSVYLDENILRMSKVQRQMFSSLVGALLEEGDSIRALKALDYCMKVVPGTTVPHDFSSTSLAEYYYMLGEKEKATDLINTIGNRSIAYLEWISKLSPQKKASAAYDAHIQLSSLRNIAYITQNYDEKTFEKYYASLMQYASIFDHLLR
ncbi:MAG TPA: hypothetical protein PKW38_07015, partial [Paludibacteraceae bacterium]|nr:hypothetical protein [Paludibacteraceae bacterium]